MNRKKYTFIKGSLKIVDPIYNDKLFKIKEYLSNLDINIGINTFFGDILYLSEDLQHIILHGQEFTLKNYNELDILKKNIETINQKFNIHLSGSFIFQGESLLHHIVIDVTNKLVKIKNIKLDGEVIACPHCKNNFFHGENN